MRGTFLHAAPRVAGALSVLSVCIWAVFFALNDFSEGDVPSAISNTVGYAAFSTVGLLILSRDARNRIGWICTVIGLSAILTFAAEEYARFAYVTTDAGVPFREAVAWLALWTWVPSTVLPITLLPLYFPSGRLLSGRWRALATLTTATTAAFIAAAALLDDRIDATAEVTNPLTVAALQPAVDATFSACLVLINVAIVGGLLSAVVRFRRARDAERLQMKWFAGAAVVSIALFVLNSAVPTGDDGNFLFGIALCCLASAIGVSILRYRLYDIDLIINRTLVYGSLTAATVGSYVALVFALSWALRAFAGEAGNEVVVAATTLIVAALFQPARRRIQRLVDRRFYRSCYDAGRTLEAFQSRLRDEVDLPTLQSDLARVVTTTLQPEAVGVWLLPSSRR